MQLISSLDRHVCFKAKFLGNTFAQHRVSLNGPESFPAEFFKTDRPQKRTKAWFFVQGRPVAPGIFRRLLAPDRSMQPTTPKRDSRKPPQPYKRPRNSSHPSSPVLEPQSPLPLDISTPNVSARYGSWTGCTIIRACGTAYAQETPR
jgi:hypothetical protein